MNNDIKELLYDILKEKTVQKRAELIQIYVDKKVTDDLLHSILVTEEIKRTHEFQNDINSAQRDIQELEVELDLAHEKLKKGKFTREYVKELEVKIAQAMDQVKDAHDYIQELEEDVERAESDYLQLAETDFIYIITSKSNAKREGQPIAAFADQKDALLFADERFKLMTESSVVNDGTVLLEKKYWNITPSICFLGEDDNFIGSIKRIRLEW